MATIQPARSAAELREVFSRNLAQLLREERSISAASRAMSISRSQIARYLSGEAFPSPDQLDRICSYFQVDANILLVPLNEAAPVDVLAESLLGVAKLMPVRRAAVSEQLLPSGVYRQWRRSFNWPDYIFTSLCRVWRYGQLTRWKAYEAAGHSLPYRNDQPERLNHTRSGASFLMPRSGYAVGTDHAVCVIAVEPETRLLRMMTLTPGFGGKTDSFVGYLALSRGASAEVSNVVPCAMERIDMNFKDMLHVARHPHYHPIAGLPHRMRAILSQCRG